LELKRLLVAFGVRFSTVTKVVADSQYWTFELIMNAVEKLQPSNVVSDRVYEVLEHTDKKLNGKCQGTIMLPDFIGVLQDHGLEENDIYMLLYKYIDTKDNLLDRVNVPGSGFNINGKDFDHLKQGNIKRLNLSNLKACKQARVKYGDLHRDLFPAGGTDVNKYWDQFEDTKTPEQVSIMEKDIPDDDNPVEANSKNVYGFLGPRTWLMDPAKPPA